MKRIRLHLGFAQETMRCFLATVPDTDAEIVRLTEVCRKLGRHPTLILGQEKRREPIKHRCFGELLTIRELAEVAGITPAAMEYRLRTMSAEIAIAMPKGGIRRHGHRTVYRCRECGQTGHNTRSHPTLSESA